MARKEWEVRGRPCLFHYSTRESAIKIATTGVYSVGNRDHHHLGSGLFLTSVRPGQMSRDKICDLLFIHQRDPTTLDGLIVLRWDKRFLETKSAGGRCYVVQQPSGSEIDLTPVLVGFAVYQGEPEEWLFSSGCYAES